MLLLHAAFIAQAPTLNDDLLTRIIADTNVNKSVGWHELNGYVLGSV